MQRIWSAKKILLKVRIKILSFPLSPFPLWFLITKLEAGLNFMSGSRPVLVWISVATVCYCFSCQQQLSCLSAFKSANVKDLSSLLARWRTSPLDQSKIHLWNMSVRCVVCTVSHEDKTHKIVLFPGISIDELNSLTQSVFQLEAPAIGLQGQVIPSMSLWRVDIDSWDTLGWSYHSYDTGVHVPWSITLPLYSHSTSESHTFHGVGPFLLKIDSCYEAIEDDYYHDEHSPYWRKAFSGCLWLIQIVYVLIHFNIICRWYAGPDFTLYHRSSHPQDH